ncbi:MAG: carbon dioxide concentrating mechanism protein CcmL [Pirellulaceae bacterium]|nr:carbon dioxide concentrating mechanism protein CcmL [Pirellulaceae bacterium]
MQIFKVIGQVTLSRSHPTFQGARLLATEPTGSSAIGGPAPVDPDLVIVWDELGAGLGSQIAVSDGAEAAQPFKPAQKPVDAFNSAILDEVSYDSKITQGLKF